MRLQLKNALCCGAAACLLLAGCSQGKSPAASAPAADNTQAAQPLSLEIAPVTSRFDDKPEVTLFLPGNTYGNSNSTSGSNQLNNVFQWKKRMYVRWNNPVYSSVEPEHIGKKLDTITSSIDTSLTGCDIYWYIPTNCEAVVAVQRGGKYELYKYYAMGFYSEPINDAKSYMNLHGIYSAADITKVEFYDYPDTSPMRLITALTKPEDIKSFYNFYAPLRDATKEYYDALDEFAEKSDDDDKDTYSRSDKDDNWSKPYAVSGAWNDRVTIRVYSSSGVYMDAEYYPRIEFINRFEVNDSFEDFLKKKASTVVWA